MIRVKARSGHVLTLADEDAASFWEARGYERVQDAPAGPKPVKKAAAKRAASKQDSK